MSFVAVQGANPSGETARAGETAPQPPPVSAVQLEAVQALWGEGFFIPVERVFAKDAIAALKLNRDKDVAIFGSALCGMARELADTLNSRVVCYEWDQGYAQAANTLNLRVTAGFSIKHFGITRSDGFPAGRQFDAIICVMRMHERKDRPQVIKAMSAALKPGGMLFLVDLVSGPEPITAERRQTIFGAAAQYLPIIWRLSDVQFALVSAGLRIDADVDITARYRDAIVANFTQMKEVVLSVLRSQTTGTVGAGDALTDQVKQWTARHDALKKGELAVRCFLATKAPKTTPRV